MSDRLVVSSTRALFFLEAVSTHARKLRDIAGYLHTASVTTLEALDNGRMPAWVLNHQTVAEVYQAEGALLALRTVSGCVLGGDDDGEAFEAMLKDPDQRHRLVVNPKSAPGAVDLQMQWRAEGWYVFDRDGWAVDGPFRTEDDAEYERDVDAGQWIGEWRDGVVDVSYAPEGIE